MANPSDIQDLADGSFDRLVINGNNAVARALLPTQTEKVALASIVGAAAYDIAVPISGKPAAAEVLLVLAIATAIRLPLALVDSKGYAAVLATASAVVTVQKGILNAGGTDFDWTDVATATWDATSKFPALAAATGVTAAVDFAAGNALRVLAPTVQDATWANIGLTLKAVTL